MDATQAIIIVFMAYRGGMPPLPFTALLVLLFGVHPHLVVLAAAAYFLHRARGKPKPKAGHGTRGPGTHAGRQHALSAKVPSWPPALKAAAAAASQGGAKGAAAAAATLGAADAAVGDAYRSRDSVLAMMATDCAIDKDSKGGGDEEVDFVVIGADIGSLFCAATLCRAGCSVAVVEPDGTPEGCGLLDQPGGLSVEGPGGLEFVVGDATLPGGKEGALYAGMLASVAPPMPTDLSPDKVAKAALQNHRQKNSSDGSSSSSGWKALSTVRGALGLGGEGAASAFLSSQAGLRPPLPWEVRWVPVGLAEGGVSSVVSLDGGRPVLWGRGGASWVATMKRHGGNPLYAQALLAKCMEAKGYARWARAKLPARPPAQLSPLDKMVASLSDPSAQASDGVFDTLCGWSAEAALGAPQIVGGSLATLKKGEPALYQLLLSHGLCRENAAASQLSYACLAAGVVGELEGRNAPCGGPRALAASLLPALSLVPGSKLIRKAKVDGVTVTKKSDEALAEATADAAAVAAEGAATNGGAGGPAVAYVATGVRLAGGRMIKARKGVVSGVGLHSTAAMLERSAAPAAAAPLVGLAGAIARARPVVHTLVALEGSAEDLQLFGADYYEVPGLLDDKGEPLSPSLGGAGCSPDDGAGRSGFDPLTSFKWLQVSFPSAKDPEWAPRFPHQSTCVITVEAEDGWADGAAFARRNPSREAALIQLLVSRFPQLEGKVAGVRSLKPRFRGLSQTVGAYPPAPQAVAAAAAQAVPASGGFDAATGTLSEAGAKAAAAVAPRVYCASHGVDGLWLSGADVIGVGRGLAPAVAGSWLAAHAALGYDATDVKAWGRNALEEALAHQ